VWSSRYVLDAKTPLVLEMYVEVFESEGRRVGIAFRHADEMTIPTRQFVVLKPEQAMRLAHVLEELVTEQAQAKPKKRLS
jgi:hypothetical protein